MYRLNFGNQTNLLSPADDNPEHFFGVSQVRAKGGSGKIVVVVRQGGQLVGFEFAASTNSWQQAWQKETYSRQENYHHDRYPWMVASSVLEDSDLVAVRHTDGFGLYQPEADDRKLTPLNCDRDSTYIGDFYDEILMGHLFPDDFIGFVTRDFGEKSVKFFAITPDTVFEEDPARQVDLQDFSLPQSWSSPHTDFLLAEPQNRTQAAIVTRSSGGLEFFMFNADYALENVLKTSHLSRRQTGSEWDRVFFANLSDQKFLDILHLNETGLAVYQFDEAKEDFVPAHYDSTFARINGWLSDYTKSIKFLDINEDDRDDLLFTGPHGLTALTFDVKLASWKSLLSLDDLSGSRRFVQVVGTLPKIAPEISRPSIFVQDVEGNLQWATVVPLIETTTTKPPMKSTTSESFEQTSPNISVPEKLPSSGTILKPDLRWSEQLEPSLFTEAVDMRNGHVQFEVPIPYISSPTQIPLGFGLFYSSQSSSSDLLGFGWSLSLLEDYIFIDHQRSIFPEDHRYFLTLHGKSLRLHLKEDGNGANVQRFELRQNLGTNVSIEYQPTNEAWVVETDAEQFFYGMSTGALQWTLAWPNWRSSGRDKESQQPLIAAWFLNKRVSKKLKKALHYNYEFDEGKISKNYTAEIRLKTITGGDQLRIDFRYGKMTSGEYAAQSPVDKEGNIAFPFGLAKKHFLQAYEIVTESYRQVLEFVYQVENGRRLLTGIQQRYLSGDVETVLQFGYEKKLESHAISSCTLPTGLKVSFAYQILRPAPVWLPRENVLSFWVTEKPKIAYGPDYTVMAYRFGGDGEIELRFTDRKMKKTETAFSLKLLPQSKDDDFSVQAFEDKLVLLLANQNSRTVCILNRLHGINWSKTPTMFHFEKDATVHLNDKIVAALEPKMPLRIRLIDESSKEATVIMPRNIIRFALNARFAVVFDDVELWRVHFDAKTRVWQKSVITLASNASQPQLPFEGAVVRQQIEKAINQNGLHVFNNVIVLNNIKASGSRLFAQVFTFLLDANYQIAKQQVFEVEREDIATMTMDHKDSNSVLTLNYVMEGSLFKLKVTRVSGEIVKRINEISNKNLRADAMKDQLAHLNEQLAENLNKQCLMKLDRYMTYIGHDGEVHIGGDLLFRSSGTGWFQDGSLVSNSIRLGRGIILETVDDAKLVYKLFAQNVDGRKTGPALREFQLHSPGKIINRYPSYLAFEPSPNVVEVLTFKNELHLGSFYQFQKEALIMESDLQNLMTAVNVTGGTHSMELLIRPLTTLISAGERLFVSEIRSTAGDVERTTSYSRSLDFDPKNLTFTETSVMVPGGKRDKWGHYEFKQVYQESTGNLKKTDRWFDADGRPVVPLIGPEENSNEEEDDDNSSNNPSILTDDSKELIISDFSPFRVTDDMVAYFGFEPYEGNNAKPWRFDASQIVRGRDSFTGESYLQLTSNSTSFEGTFRPSDQQISYVASCWLRSSLPLELNRPQLIFKSIIRTTERSFEVIRLLGETKHQQGDWFYVEQSLNFTLIREIYWNYFISKRIENSTNSLPGPEDVKFDITLKVGVDGPHGVDVDHIRLTPLQHNFKATVYSRQNGKATALILNNGLVSRSLYDHFGRQVATIQEDGSLIDVSSTSKTGRLVPEPAGTKLEPTLPVTLNIQPENGSYESFDTFAFRRRWRVTDYKAWIIGGRGQLWHKSPTWHRITPAAQIFSDSFAAVRFNFVLNSAESALRLEWGEKEFFVNMTRQLSSNSASLYLPNSQLISPVPFVGELIACLDEGNAWLWMDSVLLFEQKTRSGASSPWSSFAIVATGEVLFEDFLVMNRPHLEVDYYNEFGTKSQTLELEDSQTVLVKEILYDELGRGAIETKKTRIHHDNGNLLTFHSDFVSQRNPNSPDSVWASSHLEGDVNRFNPDDQGFPYSRTAYEANPLNEEKVKGLPGPEFSIGGSFASKTSFREDVMLLDVIFPKFPPYNFRHKVEQKPNGSKTITVLDKNDNQMAVYIEVPSFDHLLSTYEYDASHRLVKILPPAYHHHEKVKTLSTLSPFKFGTDHLSAELKDLQQTLATHFHYNSDGLLIRKISPDSGIIEFLYDSVRNKRFMVSLNSVSNQPQQVVYFIHNADGELKRSGFLKESHSTSMEILQKNVDNYPWPDAEISEPYQDFDYADEHPSPPLRGQLRRFITYNENEFCVEHMEFSSRHLITSKSIALAKTDESEQLTEFRKEYVHGKLRMLTLPNADAGRPLRITYQYNRLGQLQALGIPENPNHFATFTYHGSGQLASEEYDLNSTENLNRRYDYNSAGFLQQIADRFLIEDIAYTDNGYGQGGFGDGMVMQTMFRATWPLEADGRWFQVKSSDLKTQEARTCLKSLTRLGYLTRSGRPTKLFMRKAETALPRLFGGTNAAILAKVLAEKQMPATYGHRYSYGNHQELIRAKYFTKESEADAKPLQPDTFAEEIPELSKAQSREIWQLLADAYYLITDSRHNDLTFAIGKPGKPFFREDDLEEDLRQVNEGYVVYNRNIKHLILKSLESDQPLTLEKFIAAFLSWENAETSFPLEYQMKKQEAEKIGAMLMEKKYLPGEALTVLENQFKEVLDKYSRFLPKIVQVLVRHFTNLLGETPFDLESYSIDANGNHHHFYNGFERYEFDYRNGTNQILAVKLDGHFLNKETTYSVLHDSLGNVVQDLHLGIERIEYHPVSQRTTRIHLADKRTLRFFYDAQGERVRKQVLNADGNVTQEVHYLRDEKGRVLMDRKTVYSSAPLGTLRLVTVYLYGPRGLLGFLRNGTFYQVTTDHAGSVRLVIRNGEVVAAYDYLPYGQLMRVFGNDPMAHIAYRFTGQEFDEETGLYNYHARLYDPGTGRFLQTDPKSQYFSPYKYAGNSPVSLVDPDGEFAMLFLCIVGAVAGSYLGGAAANNRWNPVDWDFSDHGTWTGIVGGAITGALLPVGFGASTASIGVVGTVALGVGGTYLSTAAANQNWNPAEWKWDRPNTWNGAFQGFATGSGIMGGVAGMKQIATTRFATELGRAAFYTASITAGLGVAYASGVMANNKNPEFWKWDWTNPATWMAVVDGFDSGSGWPGGAVEIAHGFSKGWKQLESLSSINTQNAMKFLKNPKNPLYKMVAATAMAYLMGSMANNNFDITRWDLSSFSTYEGVLNGIFFGKDTMAMLKSIRAAKIKKLKVDVDRKAVSKYLQKRDFGEAFSHSIADGLKFRKQETYKKVIAEMFATWTQFSSKLATGESNLALSEAAAFVAAGFEAWKNGINKPPDALQRLFKKMVDADLEVSSVKLTDLKQLDDEVCRKQGEVYTDEAVDFLSCSRAKRRKKRGFAPTSCFVNVPMRENNKVESLESKGYSRAETQKLKDNPEKFWKDNALIKISVNEVTNGEAFNFKLKKTVAGGIFHLEIGLHLNDDVDVVEPSTGMVMEHKSQKAVWLEQKSKITIADSDQVQQVMTRPLSESSAVFWKKSSGGTLELYHYKEDAKVSESQQRSTKMEQLQKEFDGAIKYEQCVPEPGKVKTIDDLAELNVFLHRNNDGQWNFILQRTTMSGEVIFRDVIPVESTKFTSEKLYESTPVLQKRLKDDPIGFFEKNTVLISNRADNTAGEFTVAIEKAPEGNHYILKEAKTGIQALYLPIEKTVTAKMDGGPRLLLTAPLTGCSLRFEHDTSGNMVVYHHKRKNPESVIVNNSNGHPVNGNYGHYVLGSTLKNIEVPEGAKIVKKAGDNMVPIDEAGGTIINEPLFVVEKNGKTTELSLNVERIEDGKVVKKSLEDIIAENNELQQLEKSLDTKYGDGYLRSEQYDADLPFSDLLRAQMNLNDLTKVNVILYYGNEGKWQASIERVTNQGKRVWRQSVSLDKISSWTGQFVEDSASRRAPKRKRSVSIESEEQFELANDTLYPDAPLFESVFLRLPLNQSFAAKVMSPRSTGLQTYAAASAASKVSFWPLDFFKSLTLKVGSMLSFTENAFAVPSMPLQLIEEPSEQMSSKAFIPIQRIDVDGGLLLSILLARKWTGFRPTNQLEANSSGLDVFIDIQTASIVDDFMEKLESVDVFQDPTLHVEVMRKVRDMLKTNQADSIPRAVMQLARKHLGDAARLVDCWQATISNHDNLQFKVNNPSLGKPVTFQQSHSKVHRNYSTTESHLISQRVQNLF